MRVKTQRNKILAVLTLFLISSYPSAYAKSLEEAVATAFNTNPQLKQAYYQYRSAYHEHKRLQGQWYPSIDFRASIGAGEQDTEESRAGLEDERIRPTEFSLSLQQLLFDGFFVSENIERTNQEKLSEYYNLLVTAENKALDTTNAFIAVLREKSLAELAEKNFQAHQAIFEQIKERTESGLGSSSDLSQATGRLARARANVLVGENNLADVIAQYETEVGEMPDNLILPKANTDRIPNNLGDLLVSARKYHPILKLASADVLANLAQYKATQSNYYPTLTLELSKSRFDDRLIDNALNDETRADLVLTYNLYRGGQDKQRELSAAYQIEYAKEIKIKAERDLVEGAKLAWNAKHYYEEQLKYLQIHVEQSYQTQQAYSKQFDLGRRTLLDLLDTENELFEARKSYITAQMAYIVAQYRILNAMGQLLNSLEINPQEYWQESYHVKNSS